MSVQGKCINQYITKRDVNVTLPFYIWGISGSEDEFRSKMGIALIKNNFITNKYDQSTLDQKIFLDIFDFSCMKMGLSLETYVDVNGTLYIGKNPSSMKDNQTSLNFKKEILKSINNLLGSNEFKIEDIIEQISEYYEYDLNVVSKCQLKKI